MLLEKKRRKKKKTSQYSFVFPISVTKYEHQNDGVAKCVTAKESVYINVALPHYGGSRKPADSSSKQTLSTPYEAVQHRVQNCILVVYAGFAQTNHKH